MIGPLSICPRCMGLTAKPPGQPCPRPLPPIAQEAYPPRCEAALCPLSEDEVAAWHLGGDPAVRELVQAKNWGR